MALNVPSVRGSERQRVLAISLKSEDNDSAFVSETLSILRKVLLRELRAAMDPSLAEKGGYAQTAVI